MPQRCSTSTRRALRDLVEESGRELAAEIATDVLIIEDETFIALDLEGLVESLGHRVLGVARTHAEAVALAKAKRPGIILADIQLADGSSGLDAVNEMLRTFEVPVIFITAYPERFLTGERPEPAFLIAKPFQPSTVSAVLSQALFFERNARRRETTSELGCTVRFARQGVSKHHCFDEHDELHFALARGRRWRGSACRTVTHRPDCQGQQGPEAYTAPTKRCASTVPYALDHQRCGDGKLVDGDEGAQRDRSHKRRSAYDPATRVVSHAGDVIYPHGLAAVRQTGQKANSSHYSQHQERPVFDFICQFSKCVTTEALGFIGDRLAHACRAFFYTAHDAI